MLVPALLLHALLASPAIKPAAVQTDFLHESKQDRDTRMAWFRNARFGMFIHWGLYAQAGGEWNGKDYPGAAEWLLTNAKIKPTDYERLQPEFDPEKFDANKWVSIAKNAGMKYIVITSKHHEGFQMWPSATSTWNIGHTKFHRDPLKELSVACKKAGIKLCFYYSIMDWHAPDYQPHRSWDDRPNEDKGTFDKYVAYMKAQLKEIVTNYGPLGIIWFDGQWENTWTHERGIDLYQYVRSLQPSIIVNNRVDTRRADGGGSSADGVGDYGTPEQEIPANGIPGQDWETCMTMNDTWGFHKTDHDWKSPETLIHNLVDIASKGGNYLLNVGPTSLGEIPDGSIERLAVMGKWTKANGESLFGTSASPFPKVLPWGRVTQRPGKLYLHVFDQYKPINLLGLENRVTKAYLLSDPSRTFDVVMHDGFPSISIDKPLPDNIDTVIVADIDGKAVVNVPVPTMSSAGRITLHAEDADLHGGGIQIEEANHAVGFWNNPGDYVTWTFHARPGKYVPTLEIACDPSAAGGTYEVSIGGSSVTAVVAATKSWQTFTRVRLAPIHVDADETVTLKVRPVKITQPLMNLRSVSLAPAE
jgi:alpha-L-fucosidase